MKVVKIEKCAQCPYSLPLYVNANGQYLRCEEKGAMARLINQFDRAIEKGDPIPDWCELEEWKDDPFHGIDNPGIGKFT